MCNHQCLQAQSTQATHTGCHTAVCWMSGTGGGEENGNIAQDNVGCSVLIIYCEDLIEMGHEWTGDICLISQPWLYTLHSALSSSRQRHTIRPMQTYIWCLVEDLRKLLVKQATIIYRQCLQFEFISTVLWAWPHLTSVLSSTVIGRLSCLRAGAGHWVTLEVIVYTVYRQTEASEELLTVSWISAVTPGTGLRSAR